MKHPHRNGKLTDRRKVALNNLTTLGIPNVQRQIQELQDKPRVVDPTTGKHIDRTPILNKLKDKLARLEEDVDTLTQRIRTGVTYDKHE